MEDKLSKVDEMLEGIIDLTYNQVSGAKSKNYFSKDLAEAVGVVISLAYGRIGKNDK